MQNTTQRRFEKLIQDTINEHVDSFKKLEFAHLDPLSKEETDHLAEWEHNRELDYTHSMGKFLFDLNLTIYDAKQRIMGYWLDFLPERVRVDYGFNITNFLYDNPDYKNAFVSDHFDLENVGELIHDQVIHSREWRIKNDKAWAKRWAKDAAKYRKELAEEIE